jgi:hypothetical protein
VQPGLESLIAVKALKHLLREEKQGMTTSRLSFNNQSITLETSRESHVSPVSRPASKALAP